MGLIKGDDVKGAWMNGELYCKSCIKGDEWKDLGEGDLVVESEMDKEDFYCCDECGGRL